MYIYIYAGHILVTYYCPHTAAGHRTCNYTMIITVITLVVLISTIISASSSSSKESSSSSSSK